MQCGRIILAIVAACSGSVAQTTPVWQELVQRAEQARAEGRAAEAEALIQKAWSNVQATGPAPESFISGAQAVIGVLISSGGELSANRILHAAETAVETLPANHPNRLNVLVLRAQTLNSEQRTVEAAQAYEQVLARQIKLAGEDSAEVSNTLKILAALYDESGDLDKTEAILKRVESTTFRQQPVGGIRGGVTGGIIILGNRGGWFDRRIFYGEAALGDFYERHGRFADAEQAWQAAIERAKQKSSEPGALTSALRGYGQFLRNRRRFPEAEQLELQVIEADRAANPETPVMVIGERENLASIYADAGDFAAANSTYDSLRSEFLNSSGAESPEYRGIQQNYFFMLSREQKFDQATQIAQDMLGSSAPDNSDGNRQSALSLLGQVSQQRGDQESALRYQEQVDELNGAQQNAWDPEGIGAEIEHARQLIQQGKIDDAYALIAHAQSSAENGNTVHAANFLPQIANLASSFPDKERERADEIVSRASAAYTERVSPTSPMYYPWVFLSYNSGHGRAGEAERLLDAWLTGVEQANGPDSPRLIQPLQNAANLFSEQNQPDQALRYLLRALEIAERSQGANSREAENIQWPLATAYMNLNQWPSAVETFNRVLAMSRLIDGPTIAYANTLSNASNAFAGHGQYDCAMAFLGRAIEIARAEEPATMQAFEQNLTWMRSQKLAAAKQNQSSEAEACPAI